MRHVHMRFSIWRFRRRPRVKRWTVEAGVDGCRNAVAFQKQDAATGLGSFPADRENRHREVGAMHPLQDHSTTSSISSTTLTLQSCFP